MSRPNGAKNNNHGLAANSKFEEKFIEEGRRLTTLGLSHRSLGLYWGVSEDSITRWKERVPEFAEAIKKGEGQRNVNLLAAMNEAALQNKNPAVLIFLAKNWLGYKDYQEITGEGGEPISIKIVPAKMGAK